MKARNELSEQEYNSVKRSYFNIYQLFINEDNIPKRFVDCVVKWGVQLEITETEYNDVIKTREQFQFVAPPRDEAIEQIYDLVYMIYLDNVVEDVELEVAMKYAERLGFQPHVVGDLLKAIVAAPADGMDHVQVKKEIKQWLLGPS